MSLMLIAVHDRGAEIQPTISFMSVMYFTVLPPTMVILLTNQDLHKPPTTQLQHSSTPPILIQIS